MADLREQILDKFGDDLDDKVVHECISLCKLYTLQPEDLYYKWEAKTTNWSNHFEQTARRFDMSSVLELKTGLQRDLEERDKKARAKKMGGAARIAMRLPPGQKGNLRKQQPQKAAAVKAEDVPMDLVNTVSFKGPKEKRAYRYMYETVLQKSQVLDEQLIQFENMVRREFKMNQLEFGNPSAMTEMDVLVAGRISHDTEETTTTKVDDTTLLLETSSESGEGLRIALRFSPEVQIRNGVKGTEGLGLFPGARVLLEGKNAGGGTFTVTKIVVSPQLRTRAVAPRLKPEPQKLKLDPDFAMDLDEVPKPSTEDDDKPEPITAFSAAICCGPYTADKDLEFKPWHALVAALKQKKPSVIILLGPFVDAGHLSIRDGDVDCSPLQLFQRRMLRDIRGHLDANPGVRVLLIPSIRDLIGGHAVYPQAEFDSNVTSGDPRIHLLPNPATFSLNGVQFGATSVDVVHHLRTQEVSIKGEETEVLDSGLPSDTDGMANTCRHLLQQRSFYPIYPPPIEESDRVNLDVGHSADLEMRTLEGEYAPDVLIVPTKLKQFVKHLEGTTAVNPGFLTKGCFAMMRVGEEGGTPVERISVEIVRI
ncbi:DNA polymerase alpha, subunit B, partial [Cylindrobasidium torrendii FP15055 ss-10]